MCVVAGSSAAPFQETSSILNAIYIFIYLFHIPLLSFLSGVTGRYGPVQTIFQPVFVYTVINFLLNLMDSGKENLLQSLITPYGMMWFLPALIIWRLSIPLLDAVRRESGDRVLVFLGSLVFLSLVSGYINISGTVARTIVFYFFFAFGYLCKDELDIFVMGRRRAKTGRVMRLAGGMVVFFFLLVLVLQPDIPLGMFAGSQSYIAGGYTVFHRLLFYIISNFCCILLVLWSARLHSPILEKMGRNAFAVYLFYNFFLVVLSKTGITGSMVNLENSWIAVL